MTKQHKKWFDRLLYFVVILMGIYSLSQLMASRDTSTKANKITIAAVGDSITYGAGVASTRETESYPALLQQALGKKYHVINFGLSGRTLLSNTAKPYFKEPLAKKSFQVTPDIVIIMLGTNDSRDVYWQPQRFKKEYLAAIKRYQALESHPKIYLMIPPRVFFEHPQPTFPNNRVVDGQLRKLIPEIAKEAGVSVIDQYQGTEKHPEYFPDQLHPNLAGNLEMVDAILQQTSLNAVDTKKKTS
ncbi:GDSL-type esterase/lipase family protein [Streptococcus jiangjianxini]|uniref:GDSL-type esterase/lipase family protein n=1 Tax=Streptococcus jiangjianxini TaxID=3161189 RepID=UPI0032EFAEFB